MKYLRQHENNNHCPPPIKGMKEIPYGWPEVAPVWFGCVRWAIGVPAILRSFKEETGHDLYALAAARCLDKMIDDSMGRTRDSIVYFCDWVTVNFWSNRTEPDEKKRRLNTESKKPRKGLD